MVSTKVLVVESGPSVAIRVLVTLPLALVTRVKVMAKVWLLAPGVLVVVTLRLARLVLEAVAVKLKLVPGKRKLVS